MTQSRHIIGDATAAAYALANGARLLWRLGAFAIPSDGGALGVSLAKSSCSPVQESLT